MKIYIKDYKRLKKDTVVSLIENLLNFKVDSNLAWTCVIRSKETYYDKECKIKQCLASKRRSFEDIFNLCKTYFPNITDKKVATSLEFLFKNYKSNNKNYQFLFCNNINKWVIVCSGSLPERMIYANCYQNGDKDIKKCYAKYSLYDILKLMGYNDEEMKVNG